MNIKKLIQIILLIFVIVSVIVLLNDERKTDDISKNPKENTNTTVNKHENNMPAIKRKIPIRTEKNYSKSTSTDNLEIKDPEPVNLHKNETVEKKIRVYYFHLTRRCYTCRKIEELTYKTINNNYSLYLASGKLQFDSINVEEQQNKHFIQDFELYTSSVIIAEMKDEKIIRWKQLPEVWMLVRTDIKFSDYIKKEIDMYLSEDADG